jgi:hypothetical protein
VTSPRTRVSQFFGFLDRYRISRRVTLYISLWLTVDSYVWAKHFAEAPGTDSLQKPAIIAAVLGAVSLMQGWVLKLYIDGKEK